MTIRALVMIPTYNEALSIGSLIQELLKLPGDLEILVIDDNSPDQTATLVRNILWSRKCLSGGICLGSRASPF
jgi:dolichol-phosphate mannosyltransferase